MELFNLWNINDGWIVESPYGNPVFYGTKAACEIRCAQLNTDPPSDTDIRFMENVALKEYEKRHALR